MNAGGLIFLIVAHYLSGKGILRLFGLTLKPLHETCLSLLIGVPIISLAPCFLQLLHQPIAAKPAIVSVSVITVLASIPLLVKFRMPRMPKLKLPALCEVPYILIIMGFMALSIWRCFYNPPYARDMLSGPELLAEYAVREKSMINSVYHVDLQSTNNYFKSPYVTCLQILYKLLVTVFGQLWLSVFSLAFLVWIYSLLKERLHPFMAGFLAMLFLCMPEVYAYTYVLLYDYSNMVFFFCGFYFLSQYFTTGNVRQFMLSAFMFGLATYVRTETLILVAMTAPLVYWYGRKSALPMKTMLVRLAIFGGISAFFYALCIHVFVKRFVPIPFDLGGQLSTHLSDVSEFFKRLVAVQNELIFSPKGIGLFGYFIFVFYFLVVADLLFSRKYNRESVTMLYAIVLIMVGLPLMGYLLPVIDVNNTTKRGLFKMLPPMLLYMANSGTIRRISDMLTRLELPKPKLPKTAQPRPRPAPAPVQRQPQPQIKHKVKRGR